MNTLRHCCCRICSAERAQSGGMSSSAAIVPVICCPVARPQRRAAADRRGILWNNGMFIRPSHHAGGAGMQFALFSHVPWPEGVDPYRVMSDTTEQVQYGEELGFHGAWFAEHHFSRYGLGSSSLVLAAHIAARTSTIRLGTAVLVPPLHHPIRLAEDIAMLDLTSGGRLDIGFGRGSAGYEYHGYNLDRQESQARFQETIRIV
ncbi:MAG: LLM class flavin-dependent oxidoreductase, partial [Candidatus Tectomicrobia bacterium]|nr:LLM class flavin-dependent oxidoreductase [Candidatus Tectomicrobia bacterium]